MGQRNMLCSSSQMIDLEMEQQGQGYLHPEPCVLVGGIANIPQPDIQTMVPAPANATNLDVQRPPEHYDSAVFYGMPQYHGVHHHPHHHPPNLDLAVASASNYYVSYINPSSGISLSHRLGDQLPSSSNYGVLGVSADEYGRNSHFMDNARGSSKRKNAEGNQGHFQYFNPAASSSSSVAPLNARHLDGVAIMDTASFALPQYGGNATPSIREVGSHRSVRNRLGASGLDPVLAHNQNQFIQGNFMGQPFQPAGSIWLDQQLSNSPIDTGASAWAQPTPIHYMHGNVLGGSVESGNMGPQRYHEPANGRTNTSYFSPPPVNPRHHNFHHLSPPVQGMRGHNLNVLPQMPAPSFRAPTGYASHTAMNPSPDGLDMGRHPGPTGIRIYRSSEATLVHRNPFHLRVLPTDGVAVLEFPEYYEVENYVDHHRDMRLDIEDMSYEELLALGERIGNVNTGLSEESIRSQLKTRIFKSSQLSINLEEAASVDQEPDSCIICQDEYKNRDKIGTLGCGHEYHADCLKKWLLVKNVCPICKSEALTVEKK